MTIFFNKHNLKFRRRQLRNNMTKAEWMLWSALKNRQLKGCRFRRQFSINSFVVDFYCPKLRLAIEVDGDTHFNVRQINYDNYRQEKIEFLGIRVLRFTNIEVRNNLNEVVEQISKYLP